MNLTLAASILAISAFAQAQAFVHIGSDSLGCGEGPALLSNGAVAESLTVFDYDAPNATLAVTVHNNSPVTSGIAPPMITRIYFNAPNGTVETAQLVGQTAASGTPNFTFGFDDDAALGLNPNRADCFGNFNFRLASPSTNLGIAPPETDTVCELKQSDWVIGPVTFTFALTGPAVHGLTSEAFAASTSRLGRNTVNVAIKFDGADCVGSATLGNFDMCRTALYLRGTPNLGEQVAICVTGHQGCSAHLGLSFLPGPTHFKGYTVPLGLPAVTAFYLGDFNAPITELCRPFTIPVDQALVGLTLYFANITNPPGLPDLIGFSEALPVTIGGFQ